MSMISLVQYREGSPMSKEVKLSWEGFVEEVGFEPGVKSEEVMDAETGDDDNDGLTSE